MILNEAIVKSKNLDNIDGYFDDLQTHYKASMSTDKDLSKIAKSLKKEFNLDCEIDIVEDDSKFYGMRVYPSQEEIKKMAIVIIDKDNEGLQFESCKEVVIEIDSKLIDMATPREMTAVLIHEVGHKAVNSKESQNLKKLVVAEMAIAGIVTIPLMLIGAFIMMISLLLTVAFAYPTLLLLKNKVESDADSLSVKYGYGDSLWTFINKIDKNLVIDEKQDNKRLVKFSLERAIHFGVRKNEIRKNILEEIKVSKSPYEKEVLENQLKVLNRK